ncbi:MULTISPECIES: hypothetical protein [unclassified Mucilaginibacter]|uniref:hypothetical protein n=1 Tax=unclassified Mucilaginibacter TaxID=2617802 RepID=UPI000A45A04B|nr:MULTISPECIES: hypothetical protein [unclassified Mucilaginibacter]
MEHLFSTLLHLFVVVMMVGFVVGGILALTGSFDHWTERYRLKQRRRKLIRENEIKKARVANMPKRNGQQVADMRNPKTNNIYRMQRYVA